MLRMTVTNGPTLYDQEHTGFSRLAAGGGWRWLSSPPVANSVDIQNPDE